MGKDTLSTAKKLAIIAAVLVFLGDGFALMSLLTEQKEK